MTRHAIRLALAMVPLLAWAQTSGGVPALKEELAQEVLSREAADQALLNNIQVVQGAVATEQEGLTAESLARQTADAQLQAQIENETAQRQAADAAFAAQARSYTDDQKVTARPAATNECQYGGVVLTSRTGDQKLCNGAPGANGVPGPQGPTGPQGPPASYSLADIAGTACTLPDGTASTVSVSVCSGGVVSLMCGVPACVSGQPKCVPAGRCSITALRACAFDQDCPATETCVFASTPHPRFVDNGDQTVTDFKTCLMWEKKTYARGLHDLVRRGNGGTNELTWKEATDPSTGWLSKVHTEGGTGFAGYSDWRLPTSAGWSLIPSGQSPELESIAATPCLAHDSACVDPVFGAVGTDMTFWSASTRPGQMSDRAFAVYFTTWIGWELPPVVSDVPKDDPSFNRHFVRAVRTVR